jgi:hypothetical protein
MTVQKEQRHSSEWAQPYASIDRAELVRFGTILDQWPAALRGRSVGMALTESLLRVRTREGGTEALCANAAQWASGRRRGSSLRR